MRFITLTTDWGTRDYYVAVAKAQIHMQCPDAIIIDISHDIKPFDVVEAAFQVGQASLSFPKGTIHIIGVDTEPIINFGSSDGAFPHVLEKDGQFFLANDNGFFGALLKGERPEKLFRIEDVLSSPKALRFPTKNIFIPIAAKVFNNIPFEDFASPSTRFRNAFNANPIIEPNFIKGHIIHFDSFGNAITNIDRNLFDKIGNGSDFTIKIREGSGYEISKISTTYNEVNEGEKLALFGESGYLEIAINRGANQNGGGAEKLFGLKKMDNIRILFTYRGSHDNFQEITNF